MTAMAIRRLLAAVLMMAVPFVLSACGEDKKKQAEIDRLTEELEFRNEEIQTRRTDIESLNKEREELRTALREEKGKSRGLESKLTSAERDLERARTREQKVKERAAVVKPPSRREMSELAKEKISAKLGALVDIKGNQSSGSGFLVEADGKVWAYFAASTLAGNSKLEISRSGGEALEKFGAFEVAMDADLARLEVMTPPDENLVPAEASELASGLLLFGVSDVGVAVEGRSYEAKPDQVKVDTRIGRCPPGSPVFNGETNALLGVIIEGSEATRSLWNGRSSRTLSQRLVYRLDRKVEWQTMPIGTFLGEARTIADTDRMTRLVEAFAALRPGGEELSLDATTAGGQSSQEIFKENSSESAVKSLFELGKWLEEKKGKASASDVKRRTESAFSQMARASGKQTREIAAMKFSTFHEPIAKQSLEWRKTAEKNLGETIKSMGK